MKYLTNQEQRKWYNTIRETIASLFDLQLIVLDLVVDFYCIYHISSIDMCNKLYGESNALRFDDHHLFLGCFYFNYSNNIRIHCLKSHIIDIVLWVGWWRNWQFSDLIQVFISVHTRLINIINVKQNHVIALDKE